MLIQVTLEDIGEGARFCGDRCPLALALRRQTNAREIFVSGDVSFYRPGEDVDTAPRHMVKLPSEAVDFVHFFDIGKPVEPFSFELIGLPEFRFHDR